MKPLSRPRLFALVLTILSLPAQQTERADTQDPAPVPHAATLHAALEHLQARLSLPFAGLAVGKGERLLHSSTVGDFRSDQPIPIASASKWLAVATILTLVDDGTLDLDLPVARWLTEFDHPDRRAITLRQCLSCTAGFQASPPRGHQRCENMDAMVALLAKLPLTTGGAEFVYGGAGFQIAACAAVKKTGRDWHALFAQRIAGPLGLSHTAFGRMTPFGDGAGTAAVPWVGGGAVSTLQDYERFVRMLAQRGMFAGARVLSSKSVDLMFTSHTEGMTVRAPVRGLEGELAYGLGTWLQTFDSGTVRGSDAGALGFLPWVDRDHGVYGVLAVQDRVGRVFAAALPILDAARVLAASPAVVGKDEDVRLPHGGRDRRYLLHTPPGADRALALPLLVVLHGGGGNGEQVARSTGFSALADREGFAVIYPFGTGLLPRKLLTWNSGGIRVYAQEHEVDDVGFLKAVVADVKTRVAVDPLRVCVTGMSNGGMMCHRLAREAADVFAAIAPVAGAMNFTAVDAASPIDVLIVHGTADEHVGYAGGRPDRSVGRSGNRVDASVADAVRYYRARNGLAGEPVVEVADKVRTESWSRAGERATRLSVVTIDGGGHEWPGGSDYGEGWSATLAVWEFCKQARLAVQ